MTQVKVEHYPELRRDEYSKGITNIDNDAYTRYMNGAVVRKWQLELQKKLIP